MHQGLQVHIDYANLLFGGSQTQAHRNGFPTRGSKWRISVPGLLKVIECGRATKARKGEREIGSVHFYVSAPSSMYFLIISFFCFV